ncbi:Leu/Phe/Val dehydrogenase [Rickettsiales bacterium LUAb2]
MKIYDIINDYEQLVFFNDKNIGLKAIVCIHDTTLGPALGGCRLFNYKSEDDAIVDVARLARGMTYKSAVAGLNLGGGKCVLIGDTKSINREVMFRALGKFIEGLNGRYITAEDVNTSTSDMAYVNLSTKYVVGLDGKSGNPSAYTALGVFNGLKAAVKEQLKVDSVKGLRIAVQGLGSVAHTLCKFLHDEGASLIVTDLDSEKCNNVANQFNAKVVSPEDIMATDCDVFSPNAMGAIINDQTIDKLKAKVIAGAANNQLLEEKHDDMLTQKGILYAPDYIVNAGGVINVTRECYNVSEEQVMKKIANIYDTTLAVFALAKKEGISTHKAADKFAENRIKEIGKLDKIFTQRPKYTFPN